MRPLSILALILLAGCQVQPVHLIQRLTNMNITIAIVSFAAGVAARHYAPLGWSIAKAWITKKLSCDLK